MLKALAQNLDPTVKAWGMIVLLTIGLFGLLIAWLLARWMRRATMRELARTRQPRPTPEADPWSESGKRYHEEDDDWDVERPADGDDEEDEQDNRDEPPRG